MKYCIMFCNQIIEVEADSAIQAIIKIVDFGRLSKNKTEFTVIEINDDMERTA